MGASGRPVAGYRPRGGTPLLLSFSALMAARRRKPPEGRKAKGTLGVHRQGERHGARNRRRVVSVRPWAYTEGYFRPEGRRLSGVHPRRGFLLTTHLAKAEPLQLAERLFNRRPGLPPTSPARFESGSPRWPVPSRRTRALRHNCPRPAPGNRCPRGRPWDR